MNEQLLRVEREVRRCDHGDGVGSELGRLRGERRSVRSRLRAAVDGDLQATGGPLDVELGDATALVEIEEHTLAGRAEREEPVHAMAGEEVDVRREGIL